MFCVELSRPLRRVAQHACDLPHGNACGRQQRRARVPERVWRDILEIRALAGLFERLLDAQHRLALVFHHIP